MAKIPQPRQGGQRGGAGGHGRNMHNAQKRDTGSSGGSGSSGGGNKAIIGIAVIVFGVPVAAFLAAVGYVVHGNGWL